MNSKTIIGAVIGAIILFIWQFLSWGVINIHSPNQKYTPKQAEIIDYLKNNIGEDGTYFIPNLPPNASSDDEQKLRTESGGKPWATISYHSAFNANMTMNMARGILVNIVTIWLLMWLLAKNTASNFNTTIVSCIVVGLIGYLSLPYTNSIWYTSNTLPDLIDAIVGWGAVGAWLGYWINRK
jgi:uncharacterized membrane protein YeaQ/YmgE (transglycosylase-associated protein family)